MAKISTLREVYIEQLRDLYSAETQLIKALPKMAKAATAEDLAQGFEEHLEQTKGHAERLEQIFKALGEKPTGKKCKAMAGLVEEGAETIEEDATDEAKDAMLIAAAQRVEHYEIAGYGTVHAYAELLEEEDAAELLQQTLEEETQTDEKLTELSQTVNEKIQEGEESEEGEEEETKEPTSGSRKR